MSTPLKSKNTAGFYFQSIASFVVALGAMIVGIIYLDASAWVRGFLAIGLLYTVTSSITLAKVIRDKQEEDSVVNRVDQARLEKLLTDHDLFHPEGV